MRLEIETQSTCNRRCASCIRNSNPDKEATAPWFSKNQLPLDVIKRIFKEANDLGFKGSVCLSHYNEPLMDERIVDVGLLARTFNFDRVFMCSNGDFLTEELATGLDGTFNDIGFTLYNTEGRDERSKWIRSLFKRTLVLVSDGNDRMITHDCPFVDASAVAAQNVGRPCMHPLVRMIVNHRGEMLLCCDDLTNHFSLGSVFESSIEELWYSERHMSIVRTLSHAGGRTQYDHCRRCPRQ